MAERLNSPEPSEEVQLQTLRNKLVKCFSEDVVQEVLLKFWQWRERVENPEHWCMKVARQVYLVEVTRGRDAMRRGKLEYTDAPFASTEGHTRKLIYPQGPTVQPSQENRVLLAEVLETFPEDLLPYLERSPRSDKPTAKRSRIQRARAVLRQRFQTV